MKKKLRPLLVLEINEVPWRVIDRFASEARFPHLKEFFARSRTYTTETVDSGELSPWVIWPSLHRGIPQAEHRVSFLGQDPGSYRGVPIWEEYLKRGHSVGVCGPLQSWPPRDPGPGGFYIPDTFAHDERCIPPSVEPLQRFNLEQTSRNGRVIRGSSWVSPSVVGLLKGMPTLGVRPATWARVALQLASERVDRSRVARRATFQAALFWDVFRSLYDPARPPMYASIFTNHVASLMHRYWHQIFPEDFPERGTEPAVQEETFRQAVDAVDAMVGRAMRWTQDNPELLVAFATGMGQAAKRWERFEGFAFAVTDAARLAALTGVSHGEYQVRLAMVPQIGFLVADPGARARFRSALETMKTASGQPLFAVEGEQADLSVSVVTPKRADIEAGFLMHGDRRVSWEAAGITVHQVDNGTAYHIPEGVFALYGRGIEPDGSRAKVAATAVKGILMQEAGLEASQPAAGSATLSRPLTLLAD